MRKESAKIKIGNALLELLQSNKLEKIRVNDLIEKAGVSRNTYYYYFYSIENVLEYLSDSFFETFSFHINRTNQVPNSIYSAEEKDSPFFKACLAMWQYIYEQRRLIYTLHLQGYGYEFMQRFLQCVRDSFKPTLLHMRHLYREEPEKILSHDGFYDYYITRLSFVFYATLQTWMEHNFLDTPEMVNHYCIHGYNVYSSSSQSILDPERDF